MWVKCIIYLYSYILCTYTKPMKPFEQMDTMKSARKNETGEVGRYGSSLYWLFSEQNHWRFAAFALKDILGHVEWLFPFCVSLLPSAIYQSRLKQPLRTTTWGLKTHSWCWVTRRERSLWFSIRWSVHSGWIHKPLSVPFIFFFTMVL